ncbi:hypothetical protein HPP92_021222 [Vanilla planifolia]|uniref:Uncharacterized protein n=1 Tax=Vanilla planifolia TaxID=51239 RepID=A0A835UKI2_VANPL|nr:hypothetical protein HPP92_021601 [Vanilla planifolia]KAG0462746.1 hypothetical protein HPP92_021222 [Vanilla planifolia]
MASPLPFFFDCNVDLLNSNIKLLQGLCQQGAAHGSLKTAATIGSSVIAAEMRWDSGGDGLLLAAPMRFPEPEIMVATRNDMDDVFAVQAA